MWECKYGREPLDTRLCFLRLVRKAWLVLVMAAAGALLFGGIYFVRTVVYAPAREYKTESEFYIEYKNAVTQEQQYTFYNKETWESLIHTDVFLDEIMAQLQEQTQDLDSEMTRQDVQNAISATLLTDVRIVHVTVNTLSPVWTMALTNSLEAAFEKFGQQQREIDEIRAILIPKEASFTPIDNRTGRACILGAVVFTCFMLFFLYLYVVLDTSVYIPIEFERRFAIPMETAESDAEGHNESVYAIEQENGEYVLYVRSGDFNRPLVEKTIRDLLKEGKTVSCAVLTHADEKLITWYYKTKWL